MFSEFPRYFMNYLSNISSANPPNNSMTKSSSEFYGIPIDVLRLIASFLCTSKDVIQFGLTNRHLQCLLSDPQLWGLFLRNHFPDSYTILKSDTDRRDLYKQLTILAHNMKTGNYRSQTLNGHQAWVGDIIVYEDKFVSGSGDCTIKIWDLKTEQKLHTLKGHGGWINCIIVHEGKVISGSGDHTIKVWDLETGRELQTFNGHRSTVTDIRVYQDKLISSSWDQTIKVWDLETLKEMQTLKGHQEGVISITISDDKLISSSMDGAIKIWDLERCARVQTRPFRSGLAELSVSRAVEESPPFQGKVLQTVQ